MSPFRTLAGATLALALTTAAGAQETGAAPPAPAKPIPAAPPVGAKPALTLAQIETMLQPVPFFTVTDAKGAPMIATPKDKSKGAVGFFATPAAAEAFLAGVRTRNPASVAGTRVTAVSLWQIFKIATDPKAPFLVVFVADENEVAAARPFLKPNQKVNIPLFLGRNGTSNGLLTVNQGAQQVIPAFLSKKDLDELMARFQKTQSAVMKGVQVEVMDLEALLGMLQKATDPNLGKIGIMASRANLEYLQKREAPQKPETPGAAAPPVKNAAPPVKKP